MGKRIINLGGGSYNAHIAGDYIQGDKKQSQSEPTKSAEPVIEVHAEVVSSEIADDAETINTHSANYTEHVGGTVINGDVIGWK